VASRFPLSHGQRGWAALTVLLSSLSLLVWTQPSAGLDWQPQLAATEPWRAWTAVFVHWSRHHLLANLAACAVVGLFGWSAKLPLRCTWAWVLAWPLTQWALLLQPGLQHFGGLSGILHGGVAVVLVELLARGGRERRIAAAVSAGLLIKLWMEQPLGSALRVVDGWDIAVVPFSHLTGAVAGAICALGLRLLMRRRA
jgi:rhomboid family GlyGly-CTERM serine protease